MKKSHIVFHNRRPVIARVINDKDVRTELLFIIANVTVEVVPVHPYLNE